MISYNKKFTAVCLLVFLLLLSCSCRNNKALETESSDAPIHLVYAEADSKDSVAGQMAVAFKNKIEELSDGEIVLDLAFDGQAGQEKEVLDGMLDETGAVDITRISVYDLSGYGTDKSLLLGYPYVFSGNEHFFKFASGDLAKEFLEELEENEMPIHGLFFGEEGFEHLCSVKSVSSILDLKELNIGISREHLKTNMISALQANLKVIDSGELYENLKEGNIDVANETILNYLSGEYCKVAPNLILDGDFVDILEVVIAEDTWNSLTQGQQDVITKAAAYAQECNQEDLMNRETEALDTIKKDGVSILELSVDDKERIRGFCKEYIDEYASVNENISDLYEKILLLDD